MTCLQRWDCSCKLVAFYKTVLLPGCSIRSVRPTTKRQVLNHYSPMNEIARSPQDICLLCKSAPATKTGSHLITDFLTQAKKFKPGTLKAFRIRSKQFMRTSQSIAKENYMFCPGCEDRFAFIEDYMAREFFKRFRDPAHAAKFPLSLNKIDAGRQYRIMKMGRVIPGALKLYASMQLWRILASDPLRTYSPAIEAIRNDLDTFLGTSYQGALVLANEYSKKPTPLSITMLTCSSKIDYQRNKIGVVNKKDFSVFIVFAGEAAFEFVIPENKSFLFPSYKADSQFAETIIVENVEYWYTLNRTVGEIFQHGHLNFHK